MPCLAGGGAGLAHICAFGAGLVNGMYYTIQYIVSSLVLARLRCCWGI